MDYAVENVWKFIFETNLPFVVKGLFLLSLVVLFLVCGFWFYFTIELAKIWGRKICK